MQGRQAADYWDSYYQDASSPILPSQFAVFVANEYPDARQIVEFGCGNGRDSLFFSRQGYRVVGLDRSESAVARCREAATASRIPANFVRGCVGDESAELALQEIEDVGQGPVVVYARFFIHAIDDDEERSLLELAKSLLARGEGCLAVEFRTHRDQAQPKVTSAHFRRFVDPSVFICRASELGFRVGYFVEGFGLAKYKQDDAHVARIILKLR